jgi:hypothetical protein
MRTVIGSLDAARRLIDFSALATLAPSVTAKLYVQEDGLKLGDMAMAAYAIE